MSSNSSDCSVRSLESVSSSPSSVSSSESSVSPPSLVPNYCKVLKFIGKFFFALNCL